LFAEAGRFTEEQRNVIKWIVGLLGKESLQYMVVVFSKCKKNQTETPKLFEN